MDREGAHGHAEPGEGAGARGGDAVPRGQLATPSAEHRGLGTCRSTDFEVCFRMLVALQERLRTFGFFMLFEECNLVVSLKPYSRVDLMGMVCLN